MKKRIWCIALSLLFVLALIPALGTRAEAAAVYDLWVGGVQVTSANQNDILDDGGSAKFDSATNTLTLEDPTFAGYYTLSDGNTARIYSLLENMIIRGKATFSGPTCTWDVFCGKTDNGMYCMLELNGDFTFPSGSATANDIYAYGSISVTGGAISASTRVGLMCCGEANVYLLGGTVTATSLVSSVIEASSNTVMIGGSLRRLDVSSGGGSSPIYGKIGIQVLDKVEIVTPANAVVGTNMIYESDGTTKASHVVIVHAYDLWVGGVRVTDENLDNISGDGGRAKYNPDTRELTLNNPSLTGAYPTEGNSAVIYSKMSDLILRGSASINAAGHTWAVYAGETANGYDGSLTLDGSFTFTGASGYDVLSYGDLTVRGGDLNCGLMRGYNHDVRITGGRVTASRGIQADGYIYITDGAEYVEASSATTSALHAYGKTISLGEKIVILEPASSNVKDGLIYDGDGKVAKHVVIANPDTMRPVITTQPKSVTTTVGETAYFTVTASGDNLSYQWQFKAPGTTTWNDSGMTGAKTATLTVPVTAARSGQQYRCIVSNPGGTATSSAAKLLVKPKITTQPKSVTASAGTTVKFTVAASGGGLSYQWQFKAPGTSTWNDSGMTGAKTATLSVEATTARNGQQYRCVVKNAAGSVTSIAATLNVGAKPTITTQPQNKTAAAGTTVKFTVAASGSGLSYQWQFKAPGTTTWNDSGMTGAKTATLSVEATTARNGQQYRCIVKNSAGSTTSNAAKLTVVTKPSITTQPKNITAVSGDVVKFTVAATGGSLSYQWQYKSPSSTTWKDSGMTGNKTATLTATAESARNGQQYRCVVKNAAGTATSNAGKLTVSSTAKPTIMIDPKSVTASADSTVKFTVEASGGSGLKYQWQFKAPGTDTWYDSGMTGAKTATLTVTATAARNGQQYRCVVTNSHGTATSAAAKLTVK